MDAGTYYEATDLDAILERVFQLIRENKPQAADAILQEHNLREFVCGTD